MLGGARDQNYYRYDMQKEATSNSRKMAMDEARF